MAPPVSRADDTIPPQAAVIDIALAYHARGLPIFPVCTPIQPGRCVQHGACTHPGKRPLIPWAPFQSRLPTATDLHTWWNRWPDANTGMATGTQSGVVVLDGDGEAACADIRVRGLGEGPRLLTGRAGGEHFWFAHPGHVVGNFAGRIPGVDFRGDGGYVLLPPSLHG